MICAFGVTSLMVSAQETSLANSGNNPPKRLIFKAEMPTADKTELFEVTGTGGAIFSASNKSDGSPSSYDHNLKVTISLVTNKKPGTYNLVFYSGGDIKYAATYNNSELNVYYPIEWYESITKKLEQAFAARKKVQLRVVQNTDGYREGTLIF